MIGNQALAQQPPVARSDRSRNMLRFRFDRVEQLRFEALVWLHPLGKRAKDNEMLRIAGRSRKVEENRILPFQLVRLATILLECTARRFDQAMLRCRQQQKVEMP